MQTHMNAKMDFVLPGFVLGFVLGCGGNAKDNLELEPDAADTSVCSAPLDTETLADLAISISPNLALAPGKSTVITLGLIECCYVKNPVDVCVTWSVTPANLATIDSETGQLVISDSAQNEDVVTVSADIENGRRTVSIDVYVVTDENPLFGTWRESKQIECEGSGEVAPEQSIGELVFRADGTYAVTWSPFELYFDYWGNYSYNKSAGTLDLDLDSGNYVPADVDTLGTFEINESGELALKDIWLGAPSQSESTEPLCGHVFVR